MIRRRRSERGFVSAEWVTAVGVLLIPTFLAVLVATRLPAARSAAQVMATEAARAGAQANSCQEAKVAAATVVAALTTELGVQGTPTITFDTNEWRAGGTFTVKVSLPVPTFNGLPSIPAPNGFLEVAHVEPIDRYRFIGLGCGP